MDRVKCQRHRSPRGALPGDAFSQQHSLHSELRKADMLKLLLRKIMMKIWRFTFVI